MSKLAASLKVALCMVALNVAAEPEEYSVTVDGPLIGSNINRNRVSLGIAVNVDRTWEELSAEEQQRWRKYTELGDPGVTPPFPLPNIRAFLGKLNTPEQFRRSSQITREVEDELLLIVRVRADGVVERVEIVSGTMDNGVLTERAGILAYVYVNALLSTRFTPARLDGNPVASAFPMRIHRLTRLR